jgi:hypothetical protein
MLNKDYKEILQIFLSENVEFIVVGAYALAAHGLPRATGDIDIWVKPTKENSIKVYNALAKFGAPLYNVEESDFENKNNVFQIGIIPRRIDIVTEIDGVEFSQAEKNKLILNIDELNVPVLSLKDLLQNKKSTGREKDKLDAVLIEKIKM